MKKTTRKVLLAAITGALFALPAVAHAAPSFSVMQINLLCPDFDGPMGPGNDANLLATAKRVYQGTAIPVNQNGAEMSACKRFVKNGKGGWFNARVTWSSDKNKSLYVENTAAWAGSQGDEAHELVLFLDGNGSPSDFNKVYVDTKTNILNETGLTISVEVSANGKCEHDKVEKHCGDHHKDRGRCDHDNGKYGTCSHKRGDGKCSHDDDDDGNCIHEKWDGSDCVHKRGDGKCGHARKFGRDDDDDGKCHHERDDGGQCVHEQGDGKCGCDKGDRRHGGGECQNQWILVNQQKLKPVPWSLWALHSGDSADLYAQITNLNNKITNIKNDSVTVANHYTDEQITDLHNHIHQEIAAETISRQQGDKEVLSASTSYTDQSIQIESTIRMQQDTILQHQIDGKVSSVSGDFPITSTGGTNPVVGLAPCHEGEAYLFTNGRWACGKPAAGKPNAGSDVYNRNVVKCGNNDLLTAQTGCRFPLPSCIFPQDVGKSCPQAPADCSFVQTDVAKVCAKIEPVYDPDFMIFVNTCVQWDDLVCGDCVCNFPKLGSLLAP